MLHTRYNSVESILELDVEDGSDIILKAFEKREEDKAWELYLTRYASMDAETYVPFNEFYKQAEKVDNKSEEEILSDVKTMLDTHKF